MKAYRKIKECRICKNKNLEIVIDLKKCLTLSCFIIVSGNDCGNDSNN